MNRLLLVLRLSRFKPMKTKFVFIIACCFLAIGALAGGNGKGHEQDKDHGHGHGHGKPNGYASPHLPEHP